MKFSEVKPHTCSNVNQKFNQENRNPNNSFPGQQERAKFNSSTPYQSMPDDKFSEKMPKTWNFEGSFPSHEHNMKEHAKTVYSTTKPSAVQLPFAPEQSAVGSTVAHACEPMEVCIFKIIIISLKMITV